MKTKTLNTFILTSCILTAGLCNLMAANMSNKQMSTDQWGSTPNDKALESVVHIKSAQQESDFIESMRLYSMNNSAFKTLLLSKTSLTKPDETDLGRLVEHNHIINKFLDKLNDIYELRGFSSALTNALKTGKEEGVRKAKEVIAQKLDDQALKTKGDEYMQELRRLDRSKDFGELIRNVLENK